LNDLCTHKKGKRQISTTLPYIKNISLVISIKITKLILLNIILNLNFILKY